MALYGELLEPTPKSERELLQFSTALRHNLAIRVRVRGDAAGTVALPEKLAARKDLPEHMLNEVRPWLRQARAWKADPFVASKATAPALVKKARRLLESGPVANNFLFDNERTVDFYRASNYLHTALTLAPTSSLRAEALYLLALSTSASPEPLLWDLDMLYLEACVRQHPHSTFAKRCFDSYQERIFFGYTGSGGVHVPDDELDKLGTLRRLAY